MQVCTLLQTDNHASTPQLSFYRPDALPAAQPTASKHWRRVTILIVYKICLWTVERICTWQERKRLAGEYHSVASRGRMVLPNDLARWAVVYWWSSPRCLCETALLPCLMIQSATRIYLYAAIFESLNKRCSVNAHSVRSCRFDSRKQIRWTFLPASNLYSVTSGQ